MGNYCCQNNSNSDRSITMQSSMTVKSPVYESLEERDVNIRIESIQRDDMLLINIIKKEMRDNVIVFLLNNVIMGVQFFSDHKE